MRKRRARLAAPLTFLAIVHGLVLGAEFFAPYAPETQERSYPHLPPSRLHLFDESGRFTGLHVCAVAPDTLLEDRSTRYPVRWFVPGAPYRVAGLVRARLHLFGVDEPGRLFLLGTDGLGRDQLSRLLVGGRLSLFAGLLAAALSLGLGSLAGAVSGFAGGRVDDLLMRLAEVFLALPSIYVLLAARAFLPLQVSPELSFLLVVVVIGVMGWAGPARLVRGVALGVRERTFVAASRGFGASPFYLVRRHVLPHALGVALTHGAVLVPQAILGEVALSFLGLGVGEPAPSWGTMLAGMQQLHVLTTCWWMFAPGVAVTAVCAGYHALANAIEIDRNPTSA